MFLTRHGRDVMYHLARVVLDVPSERLPDIDSVQLVDKVDQLLRSVPFGVRWSYWILLLIFDYAAIVYPQGGLKTFTRMSRHDQVAYTSAWQNTPWSPRRLLRRFLASIIQMVYYSDAEVARACGWQPELRPAKPAIDWPVGDPHQTRTQPGCLYRAAPAASRQQHFHESADIVVIGSGAGGAVVADQLARAGHEVVLLEEGDAHDMAQFRGDVLQVMQKCYRDVGMTTTFGWPIILVPYGCSVGGTTTINSGTMIQAPAAKFDSWVQDFGLEGWQASALDAAFLDVRARLGVAPVPDAIQGPHAELFARGARALGHEVTALPRNAPDCAGSGLCCYGCPTNAKQSMALSYLPSALQHGARLYANARVESILHRNGMAAAVQGVWGRGSDAVPFTINAKTVVVCAGTMQTPLLLQRSGLSDRFRHVGRHLTLHPTVKVYAEMPEAVGAWRGVPQGMYCDALADLGIKLESIFVPPAHIALSLMNSGVAHRQVMERYAHLACFGALISDTCEGRVISFRGHAAAMYNISKADLPKYYRALEFLAQVFFAAGAERVHLPFHGAPTLEREQGIAALQTVRLRRKDLDLQAFHPLGTCRMAGDPEHGALDPTGRLHHMHNIYVADGSIFPTSLGVNPQLSIMAAAHKIAGHIDEAASS